ncbi:MAG: potassium-transporting ATPase subunit C [Solirubrobacteraceae bacterium]|jgi:potassium-transporting ATPase KdpC subunit
MKRDIITSAIGILVLTVLCGILYPLVITGVSQVAFPGNANGQQVFVHGKLAGSKIIGQNFGDLVIDKKTGKPEMQNGNPVTNPDPRYFQTRPSATAPADNAAATTFSNLGPNSKATEVAIAGNIQAYLALNCQSAVSGSARCADPYDPKVTTAGDVPVDAADTSASGVDPDISVANADIQAYRIASVRHLSLSRVDGLISTYTSGRGLGFSGEPGVDVLEVNLALDRITGGTA